MSSITQGCGLFGVYVKIAELQIRIDILLEPDAVGVAVYEEEVGGVVAAVPPADDGEPVALLEAGLVQLEAAEERVDRE